MHYLKNMNVTAIVDFSSMDEVFYDTRKIDILVDPDYFAIDLCCRKIVTMSFVNFREPFFHNKGKLSGENECHIWVHSYNRYCLLLLHQSLGPTYSLLHECN